jgi:hypothetical protein
VDEVVVWAADYVRGRGLGVGIVVWRGGGRVMVGVSRS